MQQPIISDRDKSQLKRSFRKDLKGPVQLRLFTQRQSVITVPGRECPSCPQTQQLMEELASLSPKINLETVDFYGEPQRARDSGVTRIPAVVLSNDSTSRAKFYGSPMGYEVVTIVDGIKAISRGVSPLSMDTRKKLRQVSQDVHIQVFVTQTDSNCPSLARLAHAMALDCPFINADVVVIQEFPALARTYGVRSVPSTVINEYIRFSGVVTESELLEKVLQAGVREPQERG